MPHIVSRNTLKKHQHAKSNWMTRAIGTEKPVDSAYKKKKSISHHSQEACLKNI